MHARPARHPGVPHAFVRALAPLVIAIVALVGCERRRPAPAAHLPVPVDVLADTAGAGGAPMRLTPTRPAPPRADGIGGARVWMARVSPPRPAAAEPPLPRATPDSLDLPPPEPPTLEIDEGLKPPIPLAHARLTLPRGVRPGVVELDVRVDERGAVSDVILAGGSDDAALVAAATACALAMRYRPAEQAGRPVAVWCRQRFDFTRERWDPSPE